MPYIIINENFFKRIVKKKHFVKIEKKKKI